MVPPSTTRLPLTWTELLFAVVVVPVVLLSVSCALEPLMTNEELPPTTMVAAEPSVHEPWFVTVDPTVLPMVVEPSSVSAPVLVVGPLRINVALPVVPDGPAVKVPSFSRLETDNDAIVMPLPPMPTVSVLPDDTVSSLTAKELLGTTTAALFPMQASLLIPPEVGTPALQLVAVFQSVVPAVPVQLSLHVSAAAAGGAFAMRVTPAPSAAIVPVTTATLAAPAASFLESRRPEPRSDRRKRSPRVTTYVPPVLWRPDAMSPNPSAPLHLEFVHDATPGCA